MKLAFFSPFPPKQTGVAAYSRALVDALRRSAAVTAFDHTNPKLTATDPDAVDFAATPERTVQLDEYDARIFSLGNNPHYHMEIFRILQRTHGVVLLHDTVLYYLFAGLPPGLFYRHFCECYGGTRADEILQIRADSVDGDLLRYRHPERYTFLAASLAHAETVIVHSQFAAEVVRAVAPATPVHIIPHLALAPGESPQRTTRGNELRRTCLPRQAKVLIGTFGFLGPTKRLTSICAALLDLPEDLDFHFLIVGEGPDPMPEFIDAGLGERVTWLRYVSDEDFDAWIEATDLILNLRYPSMGESSGTLSRAMGMGKTCIVTDYAAFSEYPDETVWKIPHGSKELGALGEALRILSNDSQRRQQIGMAARRHIETVHAPDQIAARLLALLAETNFRKHQQTITENRPTADALARIRHHFAERLQTALPAHLRTEVDSFAPPLPPAIPLSLSPEEIQWAFRVLLSREPHPDLEVPNLLQSDCSLKQLTRMILDSEEFRSISNPS